MPFPIPQAFTIFGQQWTIHYDEHLVHKDNDYGQAIYRENRIIIQPSTAGQPRVQASIEHTFFHELVHVIFFALSEPDLRTNEKLVDLIASCLHQVFMTMKYAQSLEEKAP